MSTGQQIPDYELEDLRIVSSPQELRAMANPLRGTILELVQERAATISELAVAVDRPKSSVAYHVRVLEEAGMLRVVRTRKVRAIDERFYGRTARIFYVGVVTYPGFDPEKDITNLLTVAAAEAEPAHAADDLRAILRHARLSPDHVRKFWQRVFELINEFMQLPPSGDTVFGFVAALYPTEHPTLPPSREDGR